MTVYVGTSGWQYRHWLGRFYPRKPRVADDLAFYAERFQTVELNGTFYKLPEAKTFADWARRTPDDFVFAMKANRFLTHIKRLKEPHDAIERMMGAAAKLGSKLGPVLVQLPPGFRCDVGRLRETLGAFADITPGTRVAFEFRDESWYTDDVRASLCAADAALCIADRGSKLITPAWRTAEWGYVRFHEGRGRPPSCYGPGALGSRARLINDIFGAAEVWAYFNNDAHGCALRDARTFARACEREGLDVTRTPSPQDVRVG